MKNTVPSEKAPWFLLLTVLFLLAAAPPPAPAQDEPTIAKDTVQVTAWTNNSYKGSYDMWSWVPRIEFRVNGPIASGSQLSVEFKLPAGPWVTFDCPTGEAQPGYWWKTECGGRDIPEAKSVTYVGPISFAIKIKNELTGTNATLFTGKAKAGKVHSNSYGPKAANEWVYYIDHDWNLPIGYIYLQGDDVHGMKLPIFHAAFWVRGEASDLHPLEPHLMYKGKEVGKIYLDGDEIGKAGCESDIENGTTHFVADSVPQKAKWQRVSCTFYNVRPWDETGEERTPLPGETGKMHLMNQNPGEYELKVLGKGKLVRSLKFTVGEDGKIVDNGIATANKLGSHKIIVPVQIIGTTDGVWDRTAWKSAFYGNPLTGFEALP